MCCRQAYGELVGEWYYDFVSKAVYKSERLLA